MDDIDERIGLEDYAYTLPETVQLSGVPDKAIRNWIDRGVIDLGKVHFTGRRLFSLADALHLAVMQDLTTRVPLKPSDAVNAAKLLVRFVLERAPVDAAGRALLDVTAIPQTLAYALAVIDGELRAGLVDPQQPGGYIDWQGEWGRTHIVLPITALVADVQWRTIAVLVARRQAGRTAP